MTVVTRFAPSPTGQLHLGHAFSALIGHELARRADGAFLLRIEDIDQTRSRPEHVAAIFDDLHWLGLDWPGPVRFQSAHMADYAAARDRLTATGLLYPCFCTRRDIAAAASAPHGPDGPVYPGTCRNLDPATAAARARAQPHALRLDVAKALARTGPLWWHDVSHGRQEARPALFGDVVLARKETPTSYHLSVTVDDALQGVTDVVRGQDLFHATHIHRLLQALLDLPTPLYRHHPLLTDAAGKRLAKRDGAPALAELRKAGQSAAILARDLLAQVPPALFRVTDAGDKRT